MTGTRSDWVGIVMLIVVFVATKPAKQCAFTVEIIIATIIIHVQPSDMTFEMQMY